MRLTKYEKETIILTSEGDDTYSVYTFNAALKRRLADFAKKYPELCRLESEDKNIGCQIYVIDEARLSIRLTAPYSEERHRNSTQSQRIRWKKVVLYAIIGLLKVSQRKGLIYPWKQLPTY